jgi:hypothetical protein
MQYGIKRRSDNAFNSVLVTDIVAVLFQHNYILN